MTVQSVPAATDWADGLRGAGLDVNPAGSLRSVLVVSGDARLIDSLVDYLGTHAIQVTGALTGADGYELARTCEFDVIVIEPLLPDIDGLTVCSSLRESSSLVPILLLSALGSEQDRIIGFAAGADDYVTKPFGVRELLARLKALVRRRALYRAPASDAWLVAHDLQLDPRGRVVRRHGVELRLKPREFDLLYWLASNPGQVFTRPQLLKRVWKYDSTGPTRTVDVHVSWLREKLELDPRRPRHLLTIRGLGYKFVP
jgi:two-component system OmpR family response regulator